MRDSGRAGVIAVSAASRARSLAGGFHDDHGAVKDAAQSVGLTRLRFRGGRRFAEPKATMKQLAAFPDSSHGRRKSARFAGDDRSGVRVLKAFAERPVVFVFDE